VRSERIARQHRMNIGTIVEEPLLKVRYAGRGGGMLGEVEEYFVNMLTPGDTFILPANCCGSSGCERRSAKSPTAAPASRKCPPTPAAACR